MNTRLKLFITALFFMGSVSASAATLTPIDVVSAESSSDSKDGGTGSFVSATYTSEGIHYYHGEAIINVETKASTNKLGTDNEKEDRGDVMLTWHVKLEVGGDSSTFSNVWVKYPTFNDLPANTTRFHLHTQNNADTTIQAFESKLEFGGKIIDHRTMGPELALMTKVGDPTGDYLRTDKYPTNTSEVDHLGIFAGGTNIDIMGSSSATLISHALGGRANDDTVYGDALSSVLANLTFEVYAAPVPEPETWAMMLAGGLLVAWQARRRGAVAAAAI